MNFNNKIRYLVSKDVVTHQKCVCADKLKAKIFVSLFNLPLINIPKTLDIIGTEISNLSILSKYKLPFFIKCNHGCKFNIYCKTKADIKTSNMRRANNYIKIGYETRLNQFQYKDIVRQIYIEEFIPIDYNINFYVFHGKPMFVETIKKSHYIKSIICNEYDIDYNPTSFTNCVKRYDLTPKHPKYKELVECTKIICKDFDFVRCDYYVDKFKKIWFSELTFSPSGGYMHFKDNATHDYFGSLI